MKTSSESAESPEYMPVYPPPTFLSVVGNYAKLAVSRNPVEMQRSFRERTLEEGTSEPSAQRTRFQAGAQRIVDAVGIQHNIEAVRAAEGANRFAAAAELGMQIENHPHRDTILKALQKRADNDYTGAADRFMNELYLLGQKVFDIFTPNKLNTHSSYFTAVFTLILCVVFFFMAAEYPRYQETKEGYELEEIFGPSALIDWMKHSSEANYQFSVRYLWTWGGRLVPWMDSGVDNWRWLTSLLLHLNFEHIINNLILFVLFSVQLERKYGTWRIALLTLLAGLGGNLLSAAFEDICLMVIGASGCCFGLLGLFVADMAINFETITFPILRIIIIMIMVILNLYTLFATKDLSNLSHLGGFITGLFPSFIFLPNLKWEKYEASFPYLGGATLLFFFLFLPLYVYLVRFPDEDCFLQDP